VRDDFSRIGATCESARRQIQEDLVPAAYSSDLRERVVHTVGEGTSRRGAAGVFKVSVSTAIRCAAAGA